MTSTVSIDGPAAMFAAYAFECAPPVDGVARRFLSDAEVIAAVDDAGVTVYALEGGGYGWRVGREIMHQPAGRTIAEAARSAAALAGLSITAGAVRWFAVAGWLASRLEDAGEIVRHQPSGVSLWGCTDAGFDPSTSPVLANIYEAVAHTLVKQPGGGGAPNYEGDALDALVAMYGDLGPVSGRASA